MFTPVEQPFGSIVVCPHGHRSIVCPHGHPSPKHGALQRCSSWKFENIAVQLGAVSNVCKRKPTETTETAAVIVQCHNAARLSMLEPGHPAQATPRGIRFAAHHGGHEVQDIIASCHCGLGDLLGSLAEHMVPKLAV